jgi:hypothetical protein
MGEVKEGGGNKKRNKRSGRMEFPGDNDNSLQKRLRQAARK